VGPQLGERTICASQQPGEIVVELADPMQRVVARVGVPQPREQGGVVVEHPSIGGVEALGRPRDVAAIVNIAGPAQRRVSEDVEDQLVEFFGDQSGSGGATFKHGLGAALRKQGLGWGSGLDSASGCGSGSGIAILRHTWGDTSSGGGRGSGGSIGATLKQTCGAGGSGGSGGGSMLTVRHGCGLVCSGSLLSGWELLPSRASSPPLVQAVVVASPDSASAMNCLRRARIAARSGSGVGLVSSSSCMATVQRIIRQGWGGGRF